MKIKKLLVIVFCIILLLSCSACRNPEKDIIGTWIDTSVSQTKEMSLTVTFFEDGTSYFTLFGSQGTTQTYSIEDGIIVITQDNGEEGSKFSYKYDEEGKMVLRMLTSKKASEYTFQKIEE